jgi:hypothetical protein
MRTGAMGVTIRGAGDRAALIVARQDRPRVIASLVRNRPRP